MLSLFKKKRKRSERVQAGSGLKVRLRQLVDEQVARGVPRQAIYDELIEKSRAALNDTQTRGVRHADANAYLSVADEVLHVMMARNRQAEQHERTGQVQQAIQLYEENLADGFAGVRPYERLRLIYTRQRRRADAIRVCRAYLALPDRTPLPAQSKDEFRAHLSRLEAMGDDDG